MKPEINLRALDALRGLLAVYVLAGHGRWLLWSGWRVWSQTPHGVLANALTMGFSLLRYGHEAVIVFFALSGFFIHLNAAKALAAGTAPPFLLGEFVRRRFRRLVPPYTFALSLTVVLDLVGRSLDPSLYAGTTGNALLDENFGHNGFGTTSVLPALVLLPGSLGWRFGSNGPLWSLSYEVVYYGLYPGWLWLRRQSAWLAYGLGLACLALALPSSIPTWSFPISVLQHYTVWLAGAWLAELLSARLQQTWVLPAAVVAVAVIGLIHLPLPLVAVLIFYSVGGTAVVLLFACLPSAVSDWRISRVWELLGVCSYSVYICHFPIVSLLCAAAFHFFGGRPASGGYAFWGSAAALLICVGCFQVCERPFLPRRRQRVLVASRIAVEPSAG